MEVTYKQESKCYVRHQVIEKAVKLLTENRETSCCVQNDYVKKTYNYFCGLDEEKEQAEASQICQEYISSWEESHRIDISQKKPEELTVCYLAGPEPENDFSEFIALGVKPNNIWAFESKNSIYKAALESINKTDFNQPKLVSCQIEQFFENTPKKFDIVYIDACCPIISNQKALKSIASLFKYHRLNSPGVLISNFAEVKSDNPILLNQFEDLVSRYFFVKNDLSMLSLNSKNNITINSELENIKEAVSKDFYTYYGNFITEIICDTASIIIPALRFTNSPFLNKIYCYNKTIRNNYSRNYINSIKYNNLLRFFILNEYIKQEKLNDKYKGTNRVDSLINEVSVDSRRINLLKSLMILNDMREQDNNIKSEITEIISFFNDTQNMFQFLDRPDKILFLDSVINQFSYPMHYCSDKILRYTYKAKETQMFTDLILFDECRYIYDWLPSIDQIPKAFSNKSWQYTFRFALDGLVKQRMNYNNEFFFKGSVTRKNESGFECKVIKPRITIKSEEN